MFKLRVFCVQTDILQRGVFKNPPARRSSGWNIGAKNQPTKRCSVSLKKRHASVPVMAEALLAQIENEFLALEISERIAVDVVDVGESIVADEARATTTIETPLRDVCSVQAFFHERNRDLGVLAAVVHRPHRHALMPDDGLPHALVREWNREVEVHHLVVAPLERDRFRAG